VTEGEPVHQMQAGEMSWSCSIRGTDKFIHNFTRETIILPVVLHGCENWSLTLREGHRVRVLFAKYN
jgi:hypothetical protein